MTRPTSRRSVLAGCAVGVCGVSGCLEDDRDVEEPIRETYPADDLSAVTVATAIGDVDVRAAARDAVAVEGRKAAVSRDDLESVGLETTVDGGILELAVERDESRSVFGFRPGPSVDLAVTVPGSLAVRRVDSRTGGIEVIDARGDLAATTETGDISLRRVDGTISATTETGRLEVVDPASIDRLATDTGDVAASLAGIDGDATIETNTGAVDLRLPDELDLTLAITTETGTITVTGVDGLPEMAGDSLIEAVVGTGRHRLEIATETGDVTVTGRD